MVTTIESTALLTPMTKSAMETTRFTTQSTKQDSVQFKCRKNENGDGAVKKDAAIVLGQFSVTRAEIGAFRQLKSSTRTNDYCVCIFEQQKSQISSMEFKDRSEELKEPLGTLINSAFDKNTVELSKLSLPCHSLSYQHRFDGKSSYTASEDHQDIQSHQQHYHKRHISSSEYSIVIWLCLSYGGPALELPHHCVSEVTYSTTTRTLSISICDSAFSSSESITWWSSYQSTLRCDDPTGGELHKTRTIDLHLSRLVDVKDIHDLLAKLPPGLRTPVQSPLLSLSTMHPSGLCGQSSRQEYSKQFFRSSSSNSSPKMTPSMILSPSTSENISWLSSSGESSPDYSTGHHNLNLQQNILKILTTDTITQQERKQHQHEQRSQSIDNDVTDKHDGPNGVLDDKQYPKVKNDQSETNFNCESARELIISMLGINYQKPSGTFPMLEKSQSADTHHNQEPFQQNRHYQYQQQQSMLYFSKHNRRFPKNISSSQNAVYRVHHGQDTSQSHDQSLRSKSDSRYAPNYFITSTVIPKNHFNEQRVYSTEENTKQQDTKGTQLYRPQLSKQSQNRQQQRQQCGNRGAQQKFKGYRRFTISHPSHNTNYTQQYHQQSQHSSKNFNKNSHEQPSHTSAIPDHQTILNQTVALQTELKEIRHQSLPSSRQRCTSSNGLEFRPITPTMSPLDWLALDWKRTRHQSCGGRLETNFTLSSESQSDICRLEQRQSRSWNQSDDQESETSKHSQTKKLMAKNNKFVSIRNLSINTTDISSDRSLDTSMSNASDDSFNRRASISSSASDASLSPSYSTAMSSSSSSTSLSNSNMGISTRKVSPANHYILTCWIGGRWPCKLRPLIKGSTLSDIHSMLRRSLKLPFNFFVDMEFDWKGQTYMIIDASHWQWAREQVNEGDMSIRCKIWKKRFAR